MAKKGEKSRGGPTLRATPQEASYTLSNLDQVKVLADPLRVRILESLCDAERTTKQVAQRLGEKPTKLYHHIDALEKVGLIRLTRTKQNRGTLEKYYLAVARSFRADSRIFQTADESGPAGEEQRATLHQVMSTIFDKTAAEVARVVAMSGSDAADAVEKAAIVSFLEIRASKEELDEIREKIQALIQSVTGTDDGAPAETADAERYRLTLAYYPLKDIDADESDR